MTSVFGVPIQATVIAIVIAHFAHELTHYAFAWAFHRKPSMGYSLTTAFYVDHTAGETLNVEDHVIHAAPAALGAVLGLAWLMGNNPVTLPMAVGWFVYTLLGIPNDMRFREVSPAGAE